MKLYALYWCGIKKVDMAAELLKFSDMNISEIGKMCGYPNQLHFSRAYKTIFGISPNRWREQNRTLPRLNRQQEEPAERSD